MFIFLPVEVGARLGHEVMALPQVVLSVLLVGQLAIEGLGAIGSSPLKHRIAGVVGVVVDNGPEKKEKIYK